MGSQDEKRSEANHKDHKDHRNLNRRVEALKITESPFLMRGDANRKDHNDHKEGMNDRMTVE
jgi:hypothetical protein